jgi:excisionase family DNA binding protein
MQPTEDVATILGVRARTVRDLIDAGDLPGYRVGRVTKVRPEDLEAYLQANPVSLVRPPAMTRSLRRARGGVPRPGSADNASLMDSSTRR